MDVLNVKKFFMALAIPASLSFMASCALAQSDPYYPDLDVVTNVMRNGASTGETLMFKVSSGPTENIEKPPALEIERRKDAFAVKSAAEPSSMYEKHSIHKLFRKNPISGDEEFNPGLVSKPEFHENRQTSFEKFELPDGINDKKSDMKKIINNDDLESFAAAVKTEADINRGYDNQNTALMLCCDKRSDRIFDYLLQRKADVNLKNSDGMTAIMIATSRGHAAMIEKLIKKLADVNAASNDGQTALILAAKNGNEMICSMLLKNGANVNARNNEGYGAWKYAVERNNQRLALMLVTCGAEIDEAFEKKMAIKFKGTAEMGNAIKPEKSAFRSSIMKPRTADEPRKTMDNNNK